ncbi:class IV adenylate cyclase [Haloimpatiens massiliensis]|uniref:class IV adenylate cyclase n=1 Tax=Haloimpatiens massiliensis TaxID=1658110 RepID=UPI000C82735A|nr:CYTH domain-containing protein [Haloimpatiens massiliensis]
MKEMEIRIINIDVDTMRNKLLSLGCAKVKEENQTNLIYDFPDKKLLNNKGYARIRIVEDLIKNKTTNYMTVKKLLSCEKYKIMEEHETEILSSEDGKNILESLGLCLIQGIKKYRESYKFKDTLIEIDINQKDFCPFPYIEIESCYENQLKEVVSLLGYTMEDTTSKTIYEILKDKGVTKGL